MSRKIIADIISILNGEDSLEKKRINKCTMGRGDYEFNIHVRNTSEITVIKPTDKLFYIWSSSDNDVATVPNGIKRVRPVCQTFHSPANGADFIHYC